MDSEKLGTEALIFAVSFFVSLLILGIFQSGCSSEFCLFVGILPFVFGASFALEYDILYSVKNKEIKIKNRLIFLVIVTFLGTLQIMSLVGYIHWRGVVIPLYFWIIAPAVLFIAIVFVVARMFEKD
ncbi:hypothetical protein AYK25_08405 [Thermoplasmatales archaeon SM1-50]|nr:MAG: hypothetical protein AYK25_08405 [Thermoplasmatales archaeon SM1-50]